MSVNLTNKWAPLRKIRDRRTCNFKFKSGHFSPSPIMQQYISCTQNIHKIYPIQNPMRFPPKKYFIAFIPSFVPFFKKKIYQRSILWKWISPFDTFHLISLSYSPTQVARYTNKMYFLFLASQPKKNYTSATAAHVLFLFQTIEKKFYGNLHFYIFHSRQGECHKYNSPYFVAHSEEKYHSMRLSDAHNCFKKKMPPLFHFLSQYFHLVCTVHTQHALIDEILTL